MANNNLAPHFVNFYSYRWCQKGIPLRSADHYKSLESERDLHLVMDGYQTTK